ncbi:hypothetical protein GCM10023187_10100 [Nibrella viscosa]|uniref:Uncharacterized protein n=1 Tax=Nibrella viscosa TaxID=1084524 RepID=A0ABP8K1R0_9BACT
MSNKRTDQPGSVDKQANHDRTRNTQARDTAKNKPHMEQIRSDQDKSVQEPEENHDPNAKTKSELMFERGGHGRSGHASTRNGSESGS